MMRERERERSLITQLGWKEGFGGPREGEGPLTSSCHWLPTLRLFSSFFLIKSPGKKGPRRTNRWQGGRDKLSRRCLHANGTPAPPSGSSHKKIQLNSNVTTWSHWDSQLLDKMSTDGCHHLQSSSPSAAEQKWKIRFQAPPEPRR